MKVTNLNLTTLSVDELEEVAGGQSVISGNSVTTAVVGNNIVTYGYTSRPAFGYGYGYGLGAAALPYAYGLGYGLGGYGLGYAGIPFVGYGLGGWWH